MTPNNQQNAGPQKPRRRFRLELVVEGDTKDELQDAFSNAGFSVFAENKTQVVSGGCSSSYHFKLQEDEAMTPETYVEALNAYLTKQAP